MQHHNPYIAVSNINDKEARVLFSELIKPQQMGSIVSRLKALGIALSANFRTKTLVCRSESSLEKGHFMHHLLEAISKVVRSTKHAAKQLSGSSSLALTGGSESYDSDDSVNPHYGPLTYSNTPHLTKRRKHSR